MFAWFRILYIFSYHLLRLCSRTFLRVSAMTTTTRFPLFKASIVNPAVGKGAGWIRSEILIVFLFFTSLIGLLRAEINWFQWDDRVMNNGDADHLCSNWSRTRILQIENNFHQAFDGLWSLHIYNVNDSITISPWSSQAPQILKIHRIFWKTSHPLKKGPPDPPKSEN